MDAKELRRIARENLAGNWALSVGVALVAGLLGALLTSSGGFNFEISEDMMQRLPESVITLLKIFIAGAGALSLAQFIIGGTVQLGYGQYLLKQYNRANFEFKDLFSQFDHFGQGFAQAFLRGLYTALWSLLFVIPGIIKSLSYAMTPFIMAENPDMTASEAINASKELMDGHKGELFWLGLTFIGWNLLSALTLGIGSLFVNPYMNAAYAAFYKDLTGSTAAVE